MKNKRGFTLVELIAVMTLLSAIILVSVPVVINTLKNNDNKVYENFEKQVKQAAELYVERNRNLYPELDNIGGSVEIHTSTLINEGYLKHDLENPTTGTNITDYIVRVEVGNDEIFIYTVKGK